MTRILVCLGVLLSAAPALANDWPRFRGPDGAGVATTPNVPVRWSATEGIRWKAELPGRGLSSPIIADGRVYLTASSGSRDARLHTLCFDAATGEKLWERQLTATGNTLCNPKTCMAAPTAVTDGKNIYALFATADLAAYDRDGNLLWYRSLTGDYPTITNQVGMAASPILWRDLLVVPMENLGESFVAGIDAKTGQNRWKVERAKDIIWVTPLVSEHSGPPVLLLQSLRELTGHDPATGKELWKYSGKGFLSIPSPASGDGMVLIPGSDLLALRVGTKAPEVLWQSNRMRPANGSPLYYQKHVYTLNSAGILNCASAADGKVLWQERLKGSFWASPVAADGKVFAVNEEGTTFVVALGDTPSIISTNVLADPILATPAFANGTIYLRSDRFLYCIGK